MTGQAGIVPAKLDDTEARFCSGRHYVARGAVLIPDTQAENRPVIKVDMTVIGMIGKTCRRVDPRRFRRCDRCVD